MHDHDDNRPRNDGTHINPQGEVARNEPGPDFPPNQKRNTPQGPLDFKYSKKPTGAVFPERAYAGSGIYDSLEPVLDGKTMQRRFLFGIPLASPLTKEKLTERDLEDFIKRGIARFEIDAKTSVNLTARRHRLPFDPNLYNQHIFLEVPFKPIRRVLRMAICSSSYLDFGDDPYDIVGGERNADPGEFLGTPRNGRKEFPSGGEIYRIPEQWIEMGNAVRGYLNVNPLTPAFTALGTAQATGAAGATILQFIGQQGWVPAYWTVEVETGMMTEDGQLPVIVNEAIGSAAAMYAIDLLLPLFRTVSQSMSVDSLSQSIQDRMIELLQDKRNTLEARYKEIIKHLKVMFGNNFFSTNV